MAPPGESRIIRRFPLARGQVRLFCFPHIGGGPSFFRAWVSRFSPHIEVCAIHLPGREERIGEKPILRFESAVKEIAESLTRFLDLPFAFFGHSMGSLIAYEVARTLAHKGNRPSRIFVSAHRTPWRPVGTPGGTLGDEEVLQFLRRMKANMDVVENDREKIFLNIIKNDLALYQSFVAPMYLQKVDCPITALGGSEDTFAPPAAIEEWADLTSAGFSSHILPGGHFYPAQNLNKLVAIIQHHLHRDNSTLPPKTGAGL